MKDLLYLIFILALIVLGCFSFYLYWQAPCSEVKNYWYLTYTPGRCL